VHEASSINIFTVDVNATHNSNCPVWGRLYHTQDLSNFLDVVTGFPMDFDCDFVSRTGFCRLSAVKEGCYWVRLNSAGIWSNPVYKCTLCSSPLPTPRTNIVPPTLDVDGSGILRAGNQHGLRLRFKWDRLFNAAAFEFLNNGDHNQPTCGVDYRFGPVASVRGSAFTNQAVSAAGYGRWAPYVVGEPGDSCLPTSAAPFGTEYYAASMDNSFSGCAWTRQETSANTHFVATVLATTIEQGAVIRNTLFTKVLETSIKVVVEFVTAVTARSANMTVFGPRIEDSQLFRTQFNPVSGCLYATLLTSVQGPYQLYPAAAGSASGLVISDTSNEFDNTVFRAALAGDEAQLNLNTGYLANAGSSTSTATVHTGTAVANRAECLAPGDSGIPDINSYGAATGNDLQYAPCTQYWFLQACSACNADHRTLTSRWTANFRVTCAPSFRGACSQPENPTVTVEFALSSDDYCPRVFDQQSASATLKVYDQATVPMANGLCGTFAHEQSQFVFGTTSFFEAQVTSAIKLEDLEAETVRIAAGAAAGENCDSSFSAECNWAGARGVLYERDVAAHGYANVSGYPPTGAVQAHRNSGTSQFAINKNCSVAGSSGLQRAVQWQWLWHDGLSGAAAAGEAPLATEVVVRLRVRYANQNTAALSAAMVPQRPRAIAALQAATAPQRPRATSVQAVADISTARVTVGVQRSPTSVVVGAGPSGGSAPEATGSAGTPVGSAAGLAAGVVAAVVVVAAVAVVRRRSAAAKRRDAMHRSATDLEMNVDALGHVDVRAAPPTLLLAAPLSAPRLAGDDTAADQRITFSAEL